MKAEPIHSKTFDTLTTTSVPLWLPGQLFGCCSHSDRGKAVFHNRQHPSGIISINLALWTGYGLAMDLASWSQVFKPPSVKRIHWSLDENSAVEEFSRFSNDSRMIEWQIISNNDNDGSVFLCAWFDPLGMCISCEGVCHAGLPWDRAYLAGVPAFVADSSGTLKKGYWKRCFRYSMALNAKSANISKIRGNQSGLDTGNPESISLPRSTIWC